MIQLGRPKTAEGCLSMRIGAIVLLCFLPSKGGYSTDATRPLVVDCGVEALYLAIASLGNNETLDGFASRLPSPGPNGHSLTDLARFAKDRGFHVRLVDTSCNNLTERSANESFACIAWIAPNHFVNIAECVEHQVTVVDFPNRRTMPISLFRKDWNGEALLISTDELASEASLSAKLCAKHCFKYLILLGLAGAVAWAGRVMHARFRKVI
ncbi:Peptidase C39 family protein [Crateriforma conspicua]|uniref:Peptidase C39 family protein n=2 Tax=Crateriforma conspicua TaxID=2527996 RepID=A0A5C5Y3C6_9PLAN|nr:Peptidase C39 family protein [Crateriforma conspicua]